MTAAAAGGEPAGRGRALGPASGVPADFEPALLGGLDDSDPAEILEWSAENVDRLAVATSFQSSGLVILHMLRRIRPGIPVLFLDTGWHFPETLEFARTVTEMWALNLVVLRGDHGSALAQDERYGPELYARDPDLCCSINKVAPLQAALEGFDGWISGVRRDQSPGRAGIRIVGRQFLPSGRLVINIHPLANWTRADVDGYVRAHRIPTHPLLERGFASIGCRPCTRPPGAGDGQRGGRWPGQDKTECGIHTFGAERQTDAEL